MLPNDISDREAVAFLPRVTILVASANEAIVKTAFDQDYAKKQVISLPSSLDDLIVPKTVSRFYNESIALSKHLTDIYFFLNDSAWFSDNEGVSRVVEKFLLEDMNYAVIYTDSFRVEQGYLSNEYLPSFTPNLFAGNQLVNNPIAVQAAALNESPFNEGIDTLCFFDIMRKTARVTMLCHLPEPIFTIKREAFDINKEMTILNNE